jgi:hypothetical protein
VFSYEFFEDANKDNRRLGNHHDLNLLEETFSKYSDCIFRARLSPPASQISHLLSEEGIKEIFVPHSETQILYLNTISLLVANNGVHCFFDIIHNR